MAQKWGFWDFEEKFCISFVWKWLKTKEEIISELLQKTACQKKIFWPRYGRKRPFLRGPEFFFPKKIFFFEKFFFAQFSKLSHFEHKNAKKKFFRQIPLEVTQGFYLRKFFRIFHFFPNFSFFFNSFNSKWLEMITIMFCFISARVTWPGKVWFFQNLAKNGRKMGKMC